MGLVGLGGNGMAEQSCQTLIEIPLQNLGIGLGPAHIQVLDVAAPSDIMRTRKPTDRLLRRETFPSPVSWRVWWFGPPKGIVAAKVTIVEQIKK